MFFVLKRRYIVFAGLITIAALVLSYGIYKTASKETFFKANEKTIIIDAGHGAQKKYYVRQKRGGVPPRPWFVYPLSKDNKIMWQQKENTLFAKIKSATPKCRTKNANSDSRQTNLTRK